MHFELAEEHRMLKDLVQKFVRDELMPLEADVMAREAEGKGLYLPDAENQRLDAKAHELGLFGLDHIDDATEKATFAAYLISLPLIPISTALLAIKEKSRWAMGSLAVGAFAVAVMTARCLQIWTTSA